MNKNGFFILLLAPILVLANQQNEALKARDEAMQALKGFNPATALNEYTATPKESTLPHATEGKDNDTLPSLGANVLGNNPAAQDVYQNSTTRAKAKPNPDSPEMRYAESLLENSDAVLDGTIGCADDSCDGSQPDISNDVQEGISRLGALAGTASDAAAHQVKNGVAAVFTGSNALCRIAAAGIGNCCGGSSRLLHCNDEERRLAKAIDEGRAFKVGKYCAHNVVVCTEKKESWCVFSSKLSSIVQIQGRYRQLGINFGTAENDKNNANCRGITPAELERINFAALNLSSIQQDLMSRMALPQASQVGADNQAKVERLHQAGKPHE